MEMEESEKTDMEEMDMEMGHHGMNIWKDCSFDLVGTLISEPIGVEVHMPWISVELDEVDDRKWSLMKEDELESLLEFTGQLHREWYAARIVLEIKRRMGVNLRDYVDSNAHSEAHNTCGRSLYAGDMKEQRGLNIRLGQFRKEDLSTKLRYQNRGTRDKRYKNENKTGTIWTVNEATDEAYALGGGRKQP
ncbi:hypothetical protein Tco_0322453 [Tanacetum coccineum]